MSSVGALKLDEVGARCSINLHVLEMHPAHVAGHFVLHVLVHHRLEAGEFPLAFPVHSHVLNPHIFQPHFLARLQEKRRHSIVNDLQVAQRDVAHEGGAALVAQQEDAGAVAPQRAVLYDDVLHVVVRAPQVQPLHGDTVVVGPDKAIRDQHILRVAGVDPVVVLHPPAAQLHIAHGHIPAGVRHDGPMGRTPDRDPAHLDVCPGDADGEVVRPLAPLIIRPVQYSPPQDADIGPLRHNRPFDHRPTGQIDCLVVAHLHFAGLMKARAEIDYSRRAGFGHFRLHRVGKQQQRTFPAIGLDTDLARRSEGNGNRMFILHV